MLRATRAAFLVALMLLPASAALAQAQPLDAAKKHYLAGKNAAAAHDYDTAIREYILAYDITKDASLFRQIGAAYEAQGKTTEAAVYYKRYLAEAGKAPDAEEVRAKLATLDAGSSTATVPSKSEPSLSEPPKLPPPDAGESATALRLAQAPLPTYADQGIRWQRTAAWISVALAAAGVTTGSILATQARSKEDDVRQLISTPDMSGSVPRFSGSTKAEYQNKIDDGNRLNNFATAAFIGGGVCAAAATVFFILDATRSVPKERISMRPYVHFGDGEAGVKAKLEF